MSFTTLFFLFFFFFFFSSYYTRDYSISLSNLASQSCSYLSMQLHSFRVECQNALHNNVCEDFLNQIHPTLYIPRWLDRQTNRLTKQHLIHQTLSIRRHANSVLVHILDKILIGQRIGRREITAVLVAGVVLHQLGRRTGTDGEGSFELLGLQQHAQSETVEVGANNLHITANPPLLPTCPPFFSITSIASLLARETSMRTFEWKFSLP